MIEEDPVDLAVHEHVHQFVTYDVSKIPHRSVVWDHYAALQEFEETAYSLRNKSWGSVSLLKMEVRAVEDERDWVRHIVIKLLFEHTVALFGKECPALCQVSHLRIVVNLEMLGLQDVPVESGVLHLVPTEIEELR